MPAREYYCTGNGGEGGQVVSVFHWKKGEGGGRVEVLTRNSSRHHTRTDKHSTYTSNTPMNSSLSAAREAVLPYLETMTGQLESTPIPSTYRQLASLVLPSSDLPTAPSSDFVASNIPVWLSAHASRSTSPLLFELEPLIAGIGVAFVRLVVVTGTLTASPDGHTSILGPSWTEFIYRAGLSCLLGSLAYMRVDYDIICALHMWSHLMPWVLGLVWRRMAKKPNERRSGKKNKKKQVYQDSSGKPGFAVYMGLSLVLLLSLPSCLVLCRILSTPSVLLGLANLMPDPVIKAVNYMFPTSELRASYDIVKSFAGTTSEGYDQMVAMLKHLLFVTFHIQMGSESESTSCPRFVRSLSDAIEKRRSRPHWYRFPNS